MKFSLLKTSMMQMGPMRIRHSSHDFRWQSSHSVDLAGGGGGGGGKPTWLPLKSGYHDVMRTSPIAGDFITVWFMKFVIFLSQGWLDPNWELRRIAVYSVWEKNWKRWHHNCTINLPIFLSQPQPLLIGSLPFTWSPWAADLSPGFLFSGERFLVESTASWPSTREVRLLAADSFWH